MLHSIGGGGSIIIGSIIIGGGIGGGGIVGIGGGGGIAGMSRSRYCTITKADEGRRSELREPTFYMAGTKGGKGGFPPQLLVVFLRTGTL